MAKIEVTSPTDVGLVIKEASGQTANAFEIQNSLGVILFYIDKDGNISSGGGDVYGPVSSTDNAVARYDGVLGAAIQDSVVTIDDTTGTIKINTHTAMTDPGAGATGTKVLNDLGQWVVGGGGAGDVVGPGSATDHAFARFDTTTGKLIQNSLVTADDSGSVNIPTGQSYKINNVALTYTDVGAAASGTGVTNGDSHNHSGGDGAQIDHTTLSNIGTNSHSAIDTAVSNSASHISAASPHSGHAIGIGSTTDNRVVRFDSTGGKQLQDSLMTIDDTGSPNIPSGQTYNINGSAHSHTGLVTNGDSHDHSGGDGAQIAHTALSSIGTNTHAQIDTHLASTSNPHSVTATQVGLSNVDNYKQVRDPGTSVDEQVLRWDGTSGDTVQACLLTVNDTGTANIPSGQTYNINGSAHAHGVATGGTGTNTWTQGNIPYSSSGTTTALTAIPNPDSTTKFLKCSNATAGAIAYEWATPSGSGDVVGPGSATDNAIARFDTTTGKLIQNSATTVADTTGSISINNASGSLIIDGNTAIVKPDGTTTKFARADGSWATPTASATYTGPFDFYVYKNGSTYYARNCQTGADDYSNSNFVTLMGSVYTAVADAAVELAANTIFSVPAGGLPLYAKHGARLCGANEYTTILQATGSCTTGVLDVRSGNAVIQNLTIDGNAQTTTVGLSVGSIGGDGYYAYHSSFQNLIVEGCSTAGIQLWDDVNYIDFSNIKCMDDHSGYGLEFRGDASSDYNSGQITFYNCVIAGPLGAVRRSWTSGGTMKGVAFYGCDFQDGHSGTYQVDCTGIYNLLFSRCIFETATSGKASTSQIRLNGYNQVFDTCSFAFRGSIGVAATFITNGTSYASALNAGYTFIGCKVWDMTHGAYNDVLFDISGGTIIGLSREGCDADSTYYSATTLANCTILDPNNAEGTGVNRINGTVNQSGSLYINSHLALADPGASPTNKFARDDGTWATPTGSVTQATEADYIIYLSSGTYYARNTRTGANDYSGAEVCAVIQSAVTALDTTGGVVFLSKPSAPLYSLSPPHWSDALKVDYDFGGYATWPIDVPEGVSIIGNDVVIDVYDINNTIFRFNNSEAHWYTEHYNITISGMTFYGNTSNTSTKAIQIKDYSFGPVIEKIQALCVSYPIELLGAVYRTTIRDCILGWGVTGISLTGDATGACNITKIIGNDISSCTTGISIGGTGTHFGVVISENWLESNGTCISGGMPTITNNFIQPGASNVGVLVSTSSPKIHGNHFSLNTSSKGIDINGTYISAVIDSNYFYCDGATAIDINDSNYEIPIIVGNQCQMTGSSYFILGYIRDATVTGNYIGGAGNGISLTNCNNTTFANNTFTGMTTAIGLTAIYYSSIVGNTFNACTTDLSTGAGNYTEISLNSFRGATSITGTFKIFGNYNLADNCFVTGPSSATDNAIARFDSTTGKIIQDSAVTVADTTGSISINNASGALIIDGNTAISKPDGTTTKYARADGTWATPGGTGDVVGPGSATDNAVARFDTTTGKLIQNSAVTIADTTGSISINNATGALIIDSLTAISKPDGTTTKFARADGTWAAPSTGSLNGPCDEFKYIVWNDSGTYKAYNTLTNTLDYSNANFVTLMGSVVSTTGITVKFLPGTYSFGSTLNILGTSYARGRFHGASEGSVTFQASTGLTDGIVRIGCDNWEIDGITFDGNNQSGCVGLRMGDKPGEGLYTALRCSVKDCTFKNFSAGTYPTCLKLDGNTYYENFENLRMMDNNLYGVHFNDDTGGLGDNGQTLFQNCEIAANYFCVWRTANAATRHRIEFDRCGFYCGSASSTYAVDFAGINNLHVNNCDFEATNTPTTAFVGVGGQNQVFTACSMYANGIPLFKSHWGGTNAGLVFVGLQCGGSSTTTLFDINYNFTVIEPNVDSSYTGKWFVSETAKRKCTIVGMPERYTNNVLYKFVDDFDGRAINSNFWSATNCDTGATVALATNKQAGVVRLSTNSTTNNQAVLDCSGVSNATWAYSTYEAIVKLDSSPTNLVYFVGLYTDANNYIGFQINTATSANWYGVSANGGVSSSVDLGVAGSTDLRFLRWWVDPTTDIAYFYVDDVRKGSLAATYVPISGLAYPRASCKTLTTAIKTFEIDRIEFTTRRT